MVALIISANRNGAQHVSKSKCRPLRNRRITIVYCWDIKAENLFNDTSYKMPSIFGFGGKTIASWISTFELGKKLDVQFITAEPSRELWDSLDSLAGVYHINIALHNHWNGMSIFWHPDSVLAAIKNYPNFGAVRTWAFILKVG